MSLQTLSLVEVPQSYVWTAGGATITNVIDASGEKVAFIVRVPKAGNISKVGIRTGTVTSSQTLRVSLQTVDSSGNPTGTLYGGSAAGTQAAPAASTTYSVTLGTPATATAGDVIAIVIEFDSSVGNLQILSFIATNLAFPYINHFTSSWAKSQSTPITWLEYDDGTCPYVGTLPGIISNLTVTTGTTPDERALKFKFPYPVRVAGVWFVGLVAASAALDVVLYDSNGTSVLQTVTFAANQVATATTGRFFSLFATPQTLLANTFYRLSLKPTTANSVTELHVIALSAAVLGNLAGGPNFHCSHRTDAGAWTDVTTERPSVGLLLDQFDDGAGGGAVIIVEDD